MQRWADAGESPADGARNLDTASLLLFASYAAEKKATQEIREVLICLQRPVIYYLKLGDVALSMLTSCAACLGMERIRFAGVWSGPSAELTGTAELLAGNRSKASSLCFCRFVVSWQWQQPHTCVFYQEKKSQNKFQHPESSVIGFLEQASRQHSPTLSARKIMSRCTSAPAVFQNLLSCKKSFQKSFQNPGGRKGRSKDKIYSNTRAYSPALPHCNFSMSKITAQVQQRIWMHYHSLQFYWGDFCWKSALDQKRRWTEAPPSSK